jgi:hypothetical protein
VHFAEGNQCRYACIVVSAVPAHDQQYARPAGHTLPYDPAGPPFVRALTWRLAIAGGGPLRYHALDLPPCPRRYSRSTARCAHEEGALHRRRHRRCGLRAIQAHVFHPVLLVAQARLLVIRGTPSQAARIVFGDVAPLASESRSRLVHGTPHQRRRRLA